MSRSWRRPYPPGRGRWWVVLWEAAALAYLHWTTSRMLDLTAPAAKALAVALALAWLAGAWRIHRIGLYVGDHGLMVRNLLTTRKIPWPEVDHIVVESIAYRIGAFSIPSGKCVMIRKNSGKRINTSLWEKGVDFHSRPDLFHSVYQSLREQHAAAKRDGSAALAELADLRHRTTAP